MVIIATCFHRYLLIKGVDRKFYKVKIWHSTCSCKNSPLKWSVVPCAFYFYFFSTWCVVTFCMQYAFLLAIMLPGFRWGRHSRVFYSNLGTLFHDLILNTWESIYIRHMPIYGILGHWSRGSLQLSRDKNSFFLQIGYKASNIAGSRHNLSVASSPGSLGRGENESLVITTCTWTNPYRTTHGKLVFSWKMLIWAGNGV